MHRKLQKMMQLVLIANSDTWGLVVVANGFIVLQKSNLGFSGNQQQPPGLKGPYSVTQSQTPTTVYVNTVTNLHWLLSIQATVKVDNLPH